MHINFKEFADENGIKMFQVIDWSFPVAADKSYVDAGGIIEQEKDGVRYLNVGSYIVTEGCFLSVQIYDSIRARVKISEELLDE